ncbi:MAG: ankyrin repeat domain-containing protein [Pseudomonadota bacterium]|nr:MAG: ankyrin repeat domain-containing protein [Pseudomonadota bacterium]
MLLFAAMFALGEAYAVATAANSDWWTAIEQRDPARIEQLIENGTDVNRPGVGGMTALMVAAGKARIALMHTLVNAGARVDQRNTRDGTALMYAAVSGDAAAVRFLLDARADSNAQSSNGWSALMIAAAKGYSDVAALLMARGADINLADIYGWTPLMRAAHEGRENIVGLMVKESTLKLDLRDESAATALHHAAIGGRVAIMQMLVDAGADTGAMNQKGLTARMIAEAAGHSDIATLLSRHER